MGASRDDPDRELTALVDEDRASAAGRERERGRWLRRAAAADARLVGVLVDLCEQGVGVAVRTRSGRTLHGVVVAVGADHVHLRTTNGLDSHVPVAGLAAVRPQSGGRAGVATGHRDATTGSRFAQVVAALADDRPRVALGLVGGGDAVVGELVGAGTDVLTVRADGPDAGVSYVALDAVADLTVVEV